MKQEKKIFEKLWFWFLVFLLLIFLVCFFPYLFTSRSFFSLDFNKTGPIGDTIGGIMGPFIAIIAAFLTFIAFWVQYQFNKEQINRFDSQETDLKVERFENKFFELLKIHRDNVQEFEIVGFHNQDDKVKGRIIFVSMVDELRLSYRTAEMANKILIGKGVVKEEYYSKTHLIKLAYLVFFDGVEEHKLEINDKLGSSSKYKVLGEYYNPLLKEFLNIVKSIQAQFRHGFHSFQIQFIIKDSTLNGIPIKQATEVLNIPNIKYMPFSGHNSRLGHYFRHLYQMVKYVAMQDEKVIENKYSYIKTIRAQLSNYEQVLLYYNAITVFGQPWIREKYLTEYRMIKNLPLYVTDFGPLPKEILPETNSLGKKLFEVDEVSSGD
ncbi:MAG: putative phage abortive infection protein [Chitinophagales bacterium]|nr:putative phage abortive infection protein [Chitinophagales bacterium]